VKLPQILFPCLFIAGAAQAQATFSIGPTVGGNLAKTHDADANAPNFHSHLDWLAGAQASVEWGKFAVQPSLLFSQKGHKFDYDVDYRNGSNLPLSKATIRNNVRLSYLTLPVNFVFAPMGAKKGLQLFAGPYVSMLLSARNVHTDKNNQPTDATVTDHLAIAETRDLFSEQLSFRRFDAGLQGGLGYRHEAWLLQASYSLGLRSTTTPYTYLGTPVNGPTTYNRAFQLSLAYLLSSTK
jgi:hypothetical protein